MASSAQKKKKDIRHRFNSFMDYVFDRGRKFSPEAVKAEYERIAIEKREESGFKELVFKKSGVPKSTTFQVCIEAALDLGESMEACMPSSEEKKVLTAAARRWKPEDWVMG
jgi:hypothetical protein